MTPANTSNAPESPQTGEKWLSVSVAAAEMGVSVRAVQKRCASGTLPARRVPGTRGEVWEVRANFNANSERELKANTNANVHRQVRPQIPLPVSNEGEQRTNQRELEGERRTFESERERELKDEVRFLRSIIEQLQRDGAETRLALKRALDLAPKQLTAAPEETTINAQQHTQSGAANNVPSDTQTTPSSALSYGDIADMIEQEMNR